MRISILVDNINSWELPYAQELFEKLKEKYSVFLVHNQKEIEAGDVAIFLSCEKLVKKEILIKNKYNLVVHASKLPEGKGFSPLTWQIIEGKNEITLTLFDAVEEVDAGSIFYQATVDFLGYELIDEMRNTLGNKINDLIFNFLSDYPDIKPIKAGGQESFYRRRTKDDSELSPEKTITEQFNLLRVVDNERYPAFFNYQGHKYLLKIYKSE